MSVLSILQRVASTKLRTLVLPASLFLAVLVSQCSTFNPSAFADELGGFDAATGQYHYYSTGPGSSSLKPSIGQPGYEQFRQQQEREDLQANQDQLRRYHSEAPTYGSPTQGNANPYNFAEPLYLPGGKTLVCQRSFNATYGY